MEIGGVASTGNKGVGKNPRSISSKNKKSPSRHTPVSCRISIGRREKQVLQYIANSSISNFNKRRCALDLDIPRSSIYDILNRLKSKELISSESFHSNYKITKLGLSTLRMMDGTGGTSIRSTDYTPAKNLSMHYTRYIAKIKQSGNINKTILAQLNPNNIEQNQMRNWTQHYAYFDDATIIFNPNQIIIRVRDVIDEDVEKAHYATFNTAIDYMKRLSKIGIQCEGMRMERAHYARIKSRLSDFLVKIDNRYYLELGNGHSFWVDHSDDKREDETDDYLYRERLDNFLLDLNDSNSIMSDVDKMKQIAASMLGISKNILQIHSNMLMPQSGQIMPETTAGGARYIG